MRKTALTLLATGFALAADPSEAVRRRAFVTSVAGTGDLSSWPDAGGQTGQAAGDAICRARATVAGLPNADAFRAWLSTASASGYCHVQGLSGHRNTGCTGGPPLPAGPWFRFTFLTNEPATEALDELVQPTGAIYRPLLFDEVGLPADGDGTTRYWTGTNDEGSLLPDTSCADWTSGAANEIGVVGLVSATVQLWTSSTAVNCNASLRLLCLEPGTSEPTGQRWASPGSLVFLTSVEGTGNLASWPQAGGESGLAAGDAICRELATEAHLPAPESFVAWLSDGTVDAAARLTSDGPFRRIDGVTIAASRADLLDGSNAGSIHQYETGVYHLGGGGGEVFTGTLEDGTGSELDCSGWTSSAPADVTKGIAGTTRTGQWTEASSSSCQFSQQLYCFSNVVTLFWDGFESGDAGRWSGVTP